MKDEMNDKVNQSSHCTQGCFWGETVEQLSVTPTMSDFYGFQEREWVAAA